MKVVFLDIDGVLNSRQFFLRTKPEDGGVDHLDPEAVAKLNEILDRTGAKVVISSTWRLINPTPVIRSMLALRGFTGEVIGETPDFPGRDRGEEIRSWLFAHPETTNFVILDDNSDMDPLKDHFVQTNFFDGLQDHHVKRCITHLNGYTQRELNEMVLTDPDRVMNLANDSLHTHAVVRARAAQAMGKIRDLDRTLPRLSFLTRNGPSCVREAAMAGLAYHLSDPRVVELFRGLAVQDPNEEEEVGPLEIGTLQKIAIEILEESADDA